jgi:hypothetical protein
MSNNKGSKHISTDEKPKGKKLNNRLISRVRVVVEHVVS